MERAYCRLHDLGYAHSAEVWKDDKLVGGLYGIRLEKVFFGESMFSKVSNASRYAFIRYVQFLKEEGVADSIEHIRLKSVNAKDAKKDLEFFFGILKEEDPKSIGDKLPQESFYYGL